MKRIIDFLKRLEQNNDRPWFNAHKDEYLNCKAIFDEMVSQVIEGIRSFDPSIGPMTPNECTYRIYRDTRFSADKTPYKVHMGAFIAPEGKKSGYSGYYFQIGPHGSGFDAGCMLASGDYCCEPRALKLLREDIAMDEGREFSEALRCADGFDLDWSQALKRVPSGVDASKEYAQWLRLKNFCLVKEIGPDYFTAPGVVNRLTSDFQSTRPFIEFINRAVEFTKNPS